MDLNPLCEVMLNSILIIDFYKLFNLITLKYSKDMLVISSGFYHLNQKYGMMVTQIMGWIKSEHIWFEIRAFQFCFSRLWRNSVVIFVTSLSWIWSKRSLSVKQYVEMVIEQEQSIKKPDEIINIFKIEYFNRMNGKLLFIKL